MNLLVTLTLVAALGFPAALLVGFVANCVWDHLHR